MPPPDSPTAAADAPGATDSFTLADLRTRLASAPPDAWPDWIARLRADDRAGARALADGLERKTARAAAQAERREALWRFEAAFHMRGLRTVAGVDEAGRGPLAGPIAAAAVVFAAPPDLPELRDSKQLTPEQREALVPRILAAAADWGVAFVDAAAIDRAGIQRANYLAMRLALADLSRPPEAVLIDGFRLPELPLPHERVVKGDQRSWSIAAASVIAKVTRDHLMEQYDAQYPAYGFAAHKGYTTEAHRVALARCGPCPIHRRSFAPVAEAAAAAPGA